MLTIAETQLLVTLATLVGRGLPTDRANVETFGRDYFGMFLAPWTRAGYAGLVAGDWPDAWEGLRAKGLLEAGRSDGGAEACLLTAEGRSLGEQSARAHPKSRYFYDEFYLRAHVSPTHAAFCERVYGRDLAQHGMLDEGQLQALVAALGLGPDDHVLELGGGDGRLAEYLSDLTGARVTVVERSPVAVELGRARTAGKRDRLDHIAADMQSVDLPQGEFSVVLAVDSLYFVADLPGYLGRLRRALAPGGRMAFFFSVWLGANEPRDLLAADGTRLAVALRSSGLEYEATDFSGAEAAHWRRKLSVARELREAFAAEGHDFLGRWRLIEAEQHQEYVDGGRLARFFYLVGAVDYSGSRQRWPGSTDR